MDFKNKTVLVTGASRSLGRRIAYDFAKNGANVIINYNNSCDEALKLADSLEKEFSSSVIALKCDVSNEDEVRNMVFKAIDKFGRIDILVNNAGICNDSLFDEKSSSDFQSILGVNLIGTYLTSKYAGKYMMDNKHGKIINISSDNGLTRGYPESADYDASKAGVISLTHNMAKFYAPFVNVNCICPGYIDTDMNEGLDEKQKDEITNSILLGRFGTVKEISDLVLFLASEKASYINDSVITVNGGIK